MRLTVVKQEDDSSDRESDDESSSLGHGVKVLKELIYYGQDLVVLFVPIRILLLYKRLKFCIKKV